MTLTATDIPALYKARKDRVDWVDVPELGYVVIDGTGAPDGPQFGAAVQALFSVSYGAHFILKRASGLSPKVMPLEALWSFPPVDRTSWRWRAMIMQPDPLDEDIVEIAIGQARSKQLPALADLRFERWEEGRCAQTLHVGPYADEATTVARLHKAIEASGYRPRLWHDERWHHEIYLGDPRRSPPDRLRTILRQPVELA